MKVLFLLSSLEPAGSETYCVSLANAWGPRHEVFWISDRLHYGQKFLSLPISQKAFPGGVANTFKASRFIKENKIDLVHSHSRRAHWVAAQAAALTRIPHVTTIHQPPPVHFFSRLFPCLGDHTIAIDEAVLAHLIKHFHRTLKNFSIIRNGIDLDLFKPVPPHGGAEKNILLLGRLSGGRWQAFQFFMAVLKRIAPSLPKTHFKIAGRIADEHRPKIEKELAAVQQAIAPCTLEILGFVNSLPALLAASDSVVAGGRSAMESLACGKPVIVLGEGGVIGLCAPDTLEPALRSNFGDHLAPKEFYPAKLEFALRQVLSGEIEKTDLARWGRMQVEKHYAVRTVANDVSLVYEKLCISRS